MRHGRGVVALACAALLGAACGDDGTDDAGAVQALETHTPYGAIVDTTGPGGGTPGAAGRASAVAAPTAADTPSVAGDTASAGAGGAAEATSTPAGTGTTPAATPPATGTTTP